MNRHEGKSPKKFLMVFGFLMPCIVIVCCYSAIFRKVRQSRQNVQRHEGGIHGQDKAHQQQQRREDLRLTKMMLLIFCCFVICFLPLSLVNVLLDDNELPNLHVLASVLAWASAVVNPFIYAFKNKQYQKAFAKVICLLLYILS